MRKLGVALSVAASAVGLVGDGRSSETGERGPGSALVLGAGRWPGLRATGAVYTSE